MATQYVMPPTYRAGRASPSVAGVRDVLAFLDYLTRQQQEEQAVKIEDARYYNREMAEERQDVRAEERADIRDIRSEEREEKRRIEDYERRFDPDDGYIKQEADIRAGVKRKGDRFAHNKQMKSLYNVGDLTADKEGWLQLNPNAISREAQTLDLMEIQKAVGGVIPGGYDSPAYWQAHQAFSEGRTTMGPESYTVASQVGGKTIFTDVYDVNQPFIPGGSGPNVDPTKDIFSSEDVDVSLRNLARDITDAAQPGEDMLSEEQLERAFLAGVADNENYQDASKVLSMANIKQGMQARAGSMELTREQKLGAQETRFRDSDKFVYDKQLLGEQALNDVFQSVYYKIFTSVDDVTSVMPGVVDHVRNIKDPDLKDAARFLFMMGSNTLEVGQTAPLSYTEKYEWLGKFIFLDQPGRGGAPSMAERIMNDAGLTAQYGAIKDILAATHPSQIQGKFVKKEDPKTGKMVTTTQLTPVYQYTVAPSLSIASQYEKYRTDMQDTSVQDAGWKQFKFSKSFMSRLDAAEAAGLFEYGYKVDSAGNRIVSLTFKGANLKERKLAVRRFLNSLIEMDKRAVAKGNPAEYSDFERNWMDAELIDIYPEEPL